MRPALLPLLVAASPAWADPRAVVADTPVVQSLVATVMGDLGTPAALVEPGASPHGGGLSPSAARALSEADLVVWTGPGLVPWVGDALASLAPDAPAVALLDSEGWEPIPAREGAGEAGPDHDHDHDHGHEAEEGHDDDGGEHGDGEEGHDHAAGGVDPHAWLDPAVAATWMGTIAEALAEADPDNAAAYRANAEAGAAAALALRDDLRARLAALPGTGIAVGHDAYRYLERAAGLPPTVPVARSDGGDSLLADVQGLRDGIVEGDVRCLVLDGEADPRWADTLGRDTDLVVTTADPEGATLEPGPGLYAALIDGLAAAFEACDAP